MPDDTNYARSIFNTIKNGSKASLKEGFTSGGIAYTTNFTNRTISGTFVFPLVESDDPVTGGTKFEVADFLTELQLNEPQG